MRIELNPYNLSETDHIVIDSSHLSSAPPPEQLNCAIEAAQKWLLDIQHEEGYWVGELEGDTILESEYILLQHFLGHDDPEKMQKLCNYMIRNWQNDDGGFAMYRGGPSDISATVKVYFACKLSGHSSEETFMLRIRDCVLRLGGVTRCNTFTKLYLSIFGQYDWEGVPTIPPEITLASNWLYINIYEMSSWSRAILVPLAIINSFRPHRHVPPGCEIDELFIGARHGHELRLPWDSRPFTWRNFFLVADKILKLHDKSPWKPLRSKAIKASEQWILERQQGSGGLGAIFPAMTHAIMAYKCLGYPDDHPALLHEITELEKFVIEDGDEIRVMPCVSPTWDTAISINALLESGLSNEHAAIQKSVDWLISKQILHWGDWAVQVPNVSPGGWAFEFDNRFYPDVDDTFMVMMAIYKACCPNGEPWTQAPPKAREALKKGLDWVFAMQNRDGSWGSFDKDNDKMIFQFVPFADHNAMLDPGTSDITARAVEMAGYFGVNKDDPRIQKALAYIRKEQESDGSWFGRWGVNYIYGTWQSLQGMAKIGEDMSSVVIRRAVNWLKNVQNPDGGWGESCASYESSRKYKAEGPSTASQTAWALLGLVQSGDHNAVEVRRGVDFLLDSQREDGSWDEPWFTGTGFPQVFYLRYHLYCHYFPLWALGRYRQQTDKLSRKDNKQGKR